MATQVKVTKSTEGPTSVKTTTYTTEYSSQSNYRPTIAARGSALSRTSYSVPSHGSMYRREVSYGVHGGMSGLSVDPGVYTAVSQTGVANIKNTREREKKDMQELNERFASYIEKVRFLEAQNRKLAAELEALRNKWGKETASVKAMYQAELDEARRLLDDAEKEKARLEIRVTSLEEQLDEARLKLDEANNHNAQLREQQDRMNTQLTEYTTEIEMLRRRIESLEGDRERDKKEIARLQEALNRARMDLDNETLAHIDAENRRQSLEEELEFLKQVHEQELKELAALAYRDTTAENREYWKNEMAQALREIQNAYDDKMDQMRGDLESFYNMKVQEFRTGATRQNMETVHHKETVKKLRDQLSNVQSRIADLEARNAQLMTENNNLKAELERNQSEWEEERAKMNADLTKLQIELDAVLKELQDLMDAKLGLELEIAAYRKLLEGEENRIGLRTIVESLVTSSHGGSASYEESDMAGGMGQVVKGEMSAKTTYQRSAKGPVSISECAADGKFICLENTGRREENLSGWSLQRVIDGQSRGDFTMPHGFSIPPGRKVKVWAKGQKTNPGPNDIESNQTTFGVGANITTKLANQGGEDRATHIQRTIYSS